MELINFDNFKSSTHLDTFGGDLIAKFLMQLLQFKKINDLYAEHYHKEGLDFLNAVLEVLEVNFEIDLDELKRIPKSGAFIVISNHPYGGLDALILIKLISEVRPDFKFLINKLLRKIEPIEDFFLPVAPFEDKNSSRIQAASNKVATDHLALGFPVGLFPAGEVSSYQLSKHEVTDCEWQTSAIKFISKAGVPVIPIYFQGSNSRRFQLLGKIHPLFRTASLPREFFNKKHKRIKIKIGYAIPTSEQDEFVDLAQFGRFLRAKTYTLGNASLMPFKFFFPLSFSKPAKPEGIIEPIPVEILLEEIELAKQDYLLFDTKEFSVVCAPAKIFPNVLHELGRLRELTFREIGEGTNLKMDIDEFDLYYHQLVIWDNDAKKIVGAYRVGKGKDIIALYGKRGFYTHTLFKMKNGFLPILSESMELGRSFIVKEYQRKPLSLFMLWKGILYFLLKNPEYRYLIGPVSISNSFSKFTKDLIVTFVETNFFSQEYGSLIVPRKRFKVNREHMDDKVLFVNSAKNDFKRLDKFIRDIEKELTTPVLLKKYISLNAKIIGFNTDPKFNNCLDGLILLDVYDVPLNTLQSLSKELNDDSILNRFVPASGEASTPEV